MQTPDKPSHAMEIKEPTFPFSQEKMIPSQEPVAFQPPLPPYSPPPEIPGPSNAPLDVPQQQHQAIDAQNNFQPQSSNNFQYTIYEEQNIYNTSMQNAAEAPVPSISVRRVSSVTKNFQRPTSGAPRRSLQHNHKQTCKSAPKRPTPRLNNCCKQCKINFLRLQLYESKYALMLRMLDEIKTNQEISMSKTVKSYSVLMGLFELAKSKQRGDISAFSWITAFCEWKMGGYSDKKSPDSSNDDSDGSNGELSAKEN